MNNVMSAPDMNTHSPHNTSRAGARTAYAKQRGSYTGGLSRVESRGGSIWWTKCSVGMEIIKTKQIVTKCVECVGKRILQTRAYNGI